MTKAMREREEAALAASLPPVRVRVVLPGQLVLEARFKATDKVALLQVRCLPLTTSSDLPPPLCALGFLLHVGHRINPKGITQSLSRPHTETPPSTACPTKTHRRTCCSAPAIQ